MHLDRRMFLGSALAASWAFAGSARADRLQNFQQRKYQELEEAKRKYAGTATGTGFLDQPEFSLDDSYRPPQTVYEPQPGDIVLSVTNTTIYKIGHFLAGAGQPSHSGIAWGKPDGSMALFEAGAYDVGIVSSPELIAHLAAYHKRGHQVWVRRRACPLTPEQVCCLASIGEREEGKRFATLRIYSQVTPFRTRGPIRTAFIGQPHGLDRDKYYCAELVSEALVACGVIRAEDARPSATFPRDLFFDNSRNPYLNHHFKLGPAGWCAPARWRPHPCQ